MKRSRVGGRCALQTEHVHALADLHREDGCSTCHEENDRSDRLTTLRHSRTREQCSTVWEVPMALNLSMLYQLMHFMIWFRSSRPTPSIKKGSVPVSPQALAQVPQREEKK